MLLGQVDSQQRFNDCAQSHAWQTEQPRTQLGVEDEIRIEAYLTQARQILTRGVEHPLVGADGVVQFGEVADGRRVEQKRSRAAPIQLDQIRALRITKPGGSFGVDGDGASPRVDRRHRAEVRISGVDD